MLRRALETTTRSGRTAYSRKRESADSRHSRPTFPLSRYGPAGSSTAAENADRAVLIRLTRFPAGIQTSCAPPVALDSLRAVFVHAGPGYGTSTVHRSWQDRHVGVAAGTRELKRARTIFGNWVGPAPAQKANRQARTATAVRREIARVENAIRRRNEAVIEELGGLNGCLHRLVGMKALL